MFKWTIIKPLFLFLANQPRRLKKIIILASDVAILFVSFYFMLLIKFEANWITAWQLLWPFCLISVFVSVPVFIKLGMYKKIVRYLNFSTYFNVIKVITLAFLVSLGVCSLARISLPSWSGICLYWILAVGLMNLSRLTVCALYEIIRTNSKARAKVAIYGAGVTGAQLLNALKVDGVLNPVLFFDDNRDLRSSELGGIKILSSNNIEKKIAKYGVTKIILAMPSTPLAVRKKIIAKLEQSEVHVLMVPNIVELAKGTKTVEDLREIDEADLLGRDLVPPKQSLLKRYVHEKVVLVTGAGGSIGSELCRQILSLKPTKLVMLERSEFALYTIEKTINQLLANDDSLSVELISCLGSINDALHVEQLLLTHHINTIYHAAAYKHVPIVENHAIEGIQNNILGTLTLAKLAIKHNVERFVFISTDKAVRPTSIMGATKRFAEKILQSIPVEQASTVFCMVRFGNVLNSSGSVIPLFRQQIKQGGPLTVTHKEVTRFFMTVSEATQLVLQAGAMANSGDLFLLEMGEPVKIFELARKMIRLSGFKLKDAESPNGDIEIKVTGLRPGEKLYEELLIDNDCVGTEHPRIMRELATKPEWTVIDKQIQQFEQCVVDYNETRAKSLLVEVVDGYQPEMTLMIENKTDKHALQLVQ